MAQEQDQHQLSPDYIYSAAYTYDFLKGIDTTGTHRPKSIHIPRKDLDKMTGMERQYWDLKRAFFDVVIFFKKGKFYELYDADAVIGNKEFGLKMTQDLNNRGKMRMSGVPEQSFAEWSRLFVFKGYKVGKVEQMVVDDALIAANGGKEPKCIPRELTVILTRGTLTENNAISGPEPIFVVAIVPQLKASASSSSTSSNSTAHHQASSFSFDAVAVDLSRQCYFYCPSDNITELVTLMHHLQPKEVLLQAPVAAANTNTNTESASSAENKMLTGVIADLLPDCHIEHIDTKNCAAFNNNNNNSTTNLPPKSWHLVYEYFRYLKIDPNALLPTKFVLDNRRARDNDDEDDADGGRGGGADDVAINQEPHFRMYSLHKKSDSNDAALVSRAEQERKNKNKNNTSSSVLDSERRFDLGMALDSAAIESLDLVVNSRDGTANSTVLSWLLADRHGMPGAARMLRQWLLRPSSNSDVISARQEAVQLLFQPPMALNPLVAGWDALFDKKSGGVVNAVAAVAPPADGPDDENGDGDDDNAAPTAAASGSAGGGGAAGGLSAPRGRKSASVLYDNVSLSAVDFERLLSRISDFKSEDTRVSLTEPLVHYPKNMQNIHTVLKGFELLLDFHRVADRALTEYVQQQQQQNNNGAAKVKLLRELVSAMGNCRSLITNLLKQFPRNRIRENDNLLLPEKGQNSEYDAAEAEIKQSEMQLQAKLGEFRSKLKDNQISYCDIGKDQFLIEIPSKNATAAALERCGVRKGELVERARTNKNVKFQVAALQPVINQHKKATTARELAIVATLRQVAVSICKGWPQLYSASRAAGYLDCLFTLSSVAKQQSCRGSVCFPVFGSTTSSSSSSSSSDVVAPPAPPRQTSLHLKGAYHPLLQLLGAKCVPNDICLGDTTDENNTNSNNNNRCLLLSGPNMAGKSTLMRTTAINVILSQIGCPACASEMRVVGEPIDRVFTRIGAKDATHLGQSTLFVELSETASILKEATGRSLCLLDELGRGTSTHDGYAIAHACLRDLAAIETEEEGDATTNNNNNVNNATSSRAVQRSSENRVPLVMFATHYHALCLEISLLEGEARQRIQLGYMDFASGGGGGGGTKIKSEPTTANDNNNNNNNNNNLVRSDVRFLYKLVPGICARSYGAEVALQAGLPRDLVENARRVSKQMALMSADHQLAEFRRFLCDKKIAMSSSSSSGAPLQEAKSNITMESGGDEALMEKVRNRARQLIAMANAATAAAE